MDRQSRDYHRPIRLTEETLRQLRTLVADVQGKALARYGASENLSLPQLAKIEHGDDPEDQRTWRFDQIRSDIRRAREVSYSIRFADGSSFDSADLGEIEETMKSRSSAPERLSDNAGRHGFFKMDLTIRKFTFHSAEWGISGVRADVRDIDIALDHLFKNSEPDFPWLYHRWQWFYTYFGSALLTIVLFVVFVAYLPLTPASQKAALDLSTVAMFLSPVFALFFSRHVEKVFPLMEFAYGRSARSRSTTRALLFQVLTVVAIPAVMAAAPSLWSQDAAPKRHANQMIYKPR